MKICPQCLKQWEDDALRTCPNDGTELRRFTDQRLKLEGRVLDGRWRIEEKIGEGGMGEVYRGHQVSVNRAVALKILRPAMASSEEYVNRFFREANLATTINHPNFVTIYDFGQSEAEKVLYLAMELLEGCDLAERMDRGVIAIDHILEIGIQICSALMAAHDAKIVHRDLKPENIFLVDVPGGGVHIKVLDFGIAKELGKSSSFTKTGQVFGTPDYMSPEQCQSRMAVDGRSDLYSLGCILYELFCGMTPFRRESVIQTLLAQVSEDARDLSIYCQAVPDSTIAVVMRLLSKLPEDRYQSAEAVRDALTRELEQVRARPEIIDSYMEAQRTTFEYDRYAEESAETIPQGRAAVPRMSSSLINLNTFEHLLDDEDILAVEHVDEVYAPAKKRRIWPLVLVVLLVGAGGGLAYFDALETQAHQALGGAVRVATKGRALAQEAGRFGAAAKLADDASERVGRRVSILATSMALAGPLETPAAEEPAARRPRTRTAPKKEAAISGVRTPSSIEARARKYEKKLVGCFSMREDINQQGKVGVRFRIKEDGSVDQVTITSSEIDSDAMKSCLVKTIDGWRFAPSALGVGVSYHERTLAFHMR